MDQHYMPEGMLRAIARKRSITDAEWSKIVEFNVFSTDLQQLPSTDQLDRTFVPVVPA